MFENIITKTVSSIISIYNPAKAIKYEVERAAYLRHSKKLRSLTGGYDAAKTGGPNQLWRPNNRSGTAENLSAGKFLKARARDLVRNNSYISGGKKKILANTIGPDLSAVFHIRDSNGKPLRELNRTLTDSFKFWSESAMLDGRSFHEFCEMVISAGFEDGECLINTTLDRNSGGNPLRLQAIENDYLCCDKGNYGIEYDEYGKPKFFHVYNQHPGNLITLGNVGMKTIEVPAESMFLYYNADRPSSYRGVSELAPIILGMYSIDQLEAAEMDAIRSASAFGLVVTSAFSAEIMERMRYTSGTPDNETFSADSDREQYVGEGGKILYLNPGENVTSFKSDRPNGNLIPFIEKILYGSSSSIGLANEELTNDYSKVNYSSARQSALVARQIYKTRRKRLERQVLKRIMRLWLQYELLTGRVPGFTYQDYVQNQAMFEKYRITFPGFDWIDPLKEIRAAEIEIKLGLNSRENIATEKNRDIYEIFDELSEEKEIMQEKGIFGGTSEMSEIDIALMKQE